MSDIMEDALSAQETSSGGNALPRRHSERVPISNVESLDLNPRKLPGDEHLTKQLEKAQCLLAYAAEAGIAIRTELCDIVLRCRTAPQKGWSDADASAFLTAFSEIAAILRPVTFESLSLTANTGAAASAADKKSRFHRRSMYTLFAILIPFSVFTFCTARLSVAIDKDIELAHQLAAKLNNELYRPSDQGTVTQRELVKEFAPGTSQASVIEDLTQFAQAVRAINWDAAKLNAFVFFSVQPNYVSAELELDQNLTDLAKLTTERIAYFQKVRYFAQSVQKDAAIWYSAIACCILPMLYALLGALAYLLRMFEQGVRNRTLPNTDGHAARFAIAAIGGFVLGLFNFSVADAATISPLAIAFLVGYAVDVFFSFLHGLIQGFVRPTADANSRSAAGSTHHA